jgi:hypothetical protein
VSTVDLDQVKAALTKLGYRFPAPHDAVAVLNELHRAIENEDVPERLRAEAQIAAGRLARGDSRLGRDGPPRRVTADLPAHSYFQREAEREVAVWMREYGTRSEILDDGAEP